MTRGITFVLDSSGLDKLREEWPEKLAALVRNTAVQVEGLAKAHAPRDAARPPQDTRPAVTGNLRNSIAAREIGPLTWEVVVGAEYGIYHEQGVYQDYVLEFGTSRIPARPFLGPSMYVAEKDFAAGLERIAREGV